MKAIPASHRLVRDSDCTIVSTVTVEADHAGLLRVAKVSSPERRLREPVIRLPQRLWISAIMLILSCLGCQEDGASYPLTPSHYRTVQVQGRTGNALGSYGTYGPEHRLLPLLIHVTPKDRKKAKGSPSIETNQRGCAVATRLGSTPVPDGCIVVVDDRQEEREMRVLPDTWDASLMNDEAKLKRLIEEVTGIMLKSKHEPLTFPNISRPSHDTPELEDGSEVNAKNQPSKPTE